MVVVFDIGSTLIEGPPYGPARRLAEMLELGPESLPALENLLFRSPSETSADLAQRIAAELGVDRAKAEAQCFALWNAQLAEAYVLPGARQVVASLAEDGIPRAYLSNIWAPFYECFRRGFPGEAECPQVLSFRSGRSKPDPKFFEEVLEAAGVAPGDALMVGDTYTNDILPAIELGMKTVWVLHRPKKEQDSLKKVRAREWPAPDVQLNSVGELTPVRIRGLFERETSFPRYS